VAAAENITVTFKVEVDPDVLEKLYRIVELVYPPQSAPRRVQPDDLDHWMVKTLRNGDATMDEIVEAFTGERR
jgi:hypothetical protein